jgi:cobalamin biosynthetic protein CobC
MRDHGGNLDEAMALHGGAPDDWVDLSTGINRQPYPLPALPESVWCALPTRASMDALALAAQQAFGTAAPLAALSGAQAAIQILPRVRPSGTARVVTPTYNEHAASLQAAGWHVEEVADLRHLAGADLAVIVNPNNPDGRAWQPGEVLSAASGVGHLIVDESFADPVPQLSLAPAAGRPGLTVLRSFGKFWGLAGLRLGFAIGSAADIAEIAASAGPWPVSGPAIEIGRRALLDTSWREAAIRRLSADAGRLDALAAGAGWSLAGGTHLFRTYVTPDASRAQDRLAQARIWTRRFPYSGTWLRLGLPGSETEWDRLARALA